MSDAIMDNMRQENRPGLSFRFTLRGLLLFVLLVAVLIWGGKQAWAWIFGPRVPTHLVQNYINESLPIGTSRHKVEEWLKGRYRHHHETQDEMGREIIRCYLPDSGPRWTPIPEDILIEFTFDSDNRLVEATAIAETQILKFQPDVLLASSTKCRTDRSSHFWPSGTVEELSIEITGIVPTHASFLPPFAPPATHRDHDVGASSG